MEIDKQDVIAIGKKWFVGKGWTPFEFQTAVWQAYLDGKSGLLNAPTGSGKTYALWMPLLLEFIKNNPDNYQKKTKNGLHVLWITPLRALAKDISIAMERVCADLEIPWQVAVRSGDTSLSEKQKQKKEAPECLITTPESLHLLLSQPGYENYFKQLKCVVVDEWHELLGNKRGTQIELALSRLKSITPSLKTWGISATIGNLDQALEVLTGSPSSNPHAKVIVKANIEKALYIESILPETVEKFPWAGHLGIRLMDQIFPIIEKSTTTLLFTNTRSQTEIWYKKLLEAKPELAGLMAMHHGSLSNEIRNWVEEELHRGKLKLVICTSSLDLGVDFRPVETTIQVGSPKGVARFLQRAGRSGHSPGAESRIYFLPTNSLELLESAALQMAIEQKVFEQRKPLERSFDVLVQYLVTLAVGGGFKEKQIFEEIKNTFAYRNITTEEWQWALKFITTGGESLGQYDEFFKVDIENDTYKVTRRKIAMRHRLSIGTIVSDPAIKIKYVTGGYIGTVEESFITYLKPGDTFWFAGRSLEYVRIKEFTLQVNKSRKNRGLIPKWMGGRMPLSSQLAEMIRQKLNEAANGIYTGIELIKLQPLLELQGRWSAIPQSNQILIERLQSTEGFHVFFYPFEGRAVHEVMAALIAYRISKIEAISFSIAMNDYGFELLSDKEIPLEEALELDLFSKQNLLDDIHQSINGTEMAKRKFRDIASIAGLIFMGYPGKNISNKHLQASSQILYDVFSTYDPNNLLVHQAMHEVLTLQLEQSRLFEAMDRIGKQEIIIKSLKRPGPFAFPIMVDRLREKLTSEKLEDRILKMKLKLESDAENH